jgi:hypothetical protein
MQFEIFPSGSMQFFTGTGTMIMCNVWQLQFHEVVYYLEHLHCIDQIPSQLQLGVIAHLSAIQNWFREIPLSFALIYGIKVSDIHRGMSVNVIATNIFNWQTKI